MEAFDDRQTTVARTTTAGQRTCVGLIDMPGQLRAWRQDLATSKQCLACAEHTEAQLRDQHPLFNGDPLCIEDLIISAA